jgi:UDP-glucose-4-epimerase GalE
LNILVTGGAGYIGSHCCKELKKAGYHPITIDNLVYGHRESVRWGEFVEGDIGDRAVLDAIWGRHEIQAVMHFSAYAYVGESVTDPRKYYRNNVASTLCLLDWMLDNNIRYFIFSSTCATYGNPHYTPIDEQHPREPINPYGRTKLTVEEILKDYSAAYDLKYMSLRYFNAAGADPDGETGENHDPETHLIPLILDVAAGRSGAINVFGNDYDTEDGSCIRDYIHVTDLARAHILALERLLNGSGSDIINLGTGRGCSVLQTIEIARAVTGRPVPVNITARRPGDPPVLVAANGKADRRLGWKPAYTDLKDIIQTAWNWHRKLND